jgi:tRNA A58 N-methylase Trm61
MTYTQTVDIPDNRRLTIDVPKEVPAGRVILTFKPVAENEETTYTTLSKEDAISMTAEVIEKYRPALEELAK